MKQIRYFLMGCLLLVLVTSNTIMVQAMNSGFLLAEPSEKERNTFLGNVEISMLTDEPSMKAIECFDVNEDGLIAIGHASSEAKTIAVYTQDGTFQYGYKFNAMGTFGVEWDEDKLMIYFVRSDIALCVNSTGKVESISKIQDTTENNSYWNNYVFSTKRSVGGTEYRIRNDMGILNLFASSYSRLIAVNPDGEETILYDVNTTQFIKMLVLFVGVIVWITLIILSLIKWIKTNRG